MQIRGTVRDKNGKSVPGVIVYAYHTDAAGLYPPDDKFKGQAAYRHGRLRGWAITDERGTYRFDTIRPAGYPDSELPAHVHMHIIEVGRCTYYIDDLMFDDDPRLTRRQRQKLTHGRGGTGVAAPIRNQSNIWVVSRDIVLGEKIPGYPERAEQSDRDRDPDFSGTPPTPPMADRTVRMFHGLGDDPLDLRKRFPELLTTRASSAFARSAIDRTTGKYEKIEHQGFMGKKGGGP